MTAVVGFCGECGQECAVYLEPGDPSVGIGDALYSSCCGEACYRDPELITEMTTDEYEIQRADSAADEAYDRARDEGEAD